MRAERLSKNIYLIPRQPTAPSRDEDGPKPYLGETTLLTQAIVLAHRWLPNDHHLALACEPRFIEIGVIHRKQPRLV